MRNVNKKMSGSFKAPLHLVVTPCTYIGCVSLCRYICKASLQSSAQGSVFHGEDIGPLNLRWCVPIKAEVASPSTMPSSHALKGWHDCRDLCLPPMGGGGMCGLVQMSNYKRHRSITFSSTPILIPIESAILLPPPSKACPKNPYSD